MYYILYFLFSAYLFAGPEEPNPDYITRDVKQKIYTPKGMEPENDYNNDYDLLEDDNDDDEEDN